MWQAYEKLQMKCQEFICFVSDLKLPLVRSELTGLTDAGPGVGVSNLEVRFRYADQFARVHCSDYRVRVHRSRDDSSQNEAERTKSSITDSIVAGGTIDWNFHKEFDDLTDQQVQSFSLQQYETSEKQKLQKNAWHVSEIVKEKLNR